MKRIIAMNGSGRVGKGSFVAACKHYLQEVQYVSYVDYVRYKIAPLLGYLGGKTERDRKFLSDLQDISSEYNDYPYFRLDNMIQYFFKTTRGSAVLFIDIREPNIIKRVVDDYGAKTVLLRRTDAPNIKGNHADAEVENYDYDFYIDNNGSLEDLQEKAKEFCEKIMSIKKKCNTECIKCGYNLTDKQGVTCGKSGVLSTLQKALHGYHSGDMIPMGYDTLAELATLLIKQKLED